MKRLVSITLSVMLVVAAVFAAGCDFFGVGGYKNWFIDANDGVKKYLVTNVSEVSLVPEGTVTVHASVEEREGEAVFNDSLVVEWSSANTNIATVSSSGVITGVGLGKTKVYASIAEDVKTAVTVTVSKKTLTGITIENAKTVYLLGSTYTPDFTCVARFGDGYTETVSTADLDVRSGKFDSSREGTYDIEVRYTFDGVTAVAHYNVSVQATITYSPKYLDYTYSDLKKSNRYANLQTGYCPSSGDINYLLIPVYFTDSNQWVSETQKNSVKETVSKAFFGESNSNGWNSVKSFYETESMGKLSITGKVSDWYDADYATSYYGTSSDRVNNLAIDAVNWYFTQNPTEDRTDYDSDGNGILDAVALIYACPNYTDNSISDEYKNFWAMVVRGGMQTQTATARNPGINFYLWASYTEAFTDLSNSTADSHTYIHETGHLFGLEDYYDYGDRYWATGGFITMELNTGSQDPFSCLALGWAQAIVPEESCTIELKDFQTDRKVIVLSNNPRGFNSPFDEYIIIELYSPYGLNKFDTANSWQGFYSTGASKVGVRIWHVDARLTTYDTLTGGYTTTLGTDPTVRNTETAFTNTWDVEGRISPLGTSYQDYSLLFGIRNGSPLLTYKPMEANSKLNNSALFYQGANFSVSGFNYKKQFVNNGKMNDGSSFMWTVSVGSITGSESSGYTAVINLTAA
ncbi:MAG: hypothetical protein SPL13_05285 [Clostridia bacterium]|nr:hypothetical protein [Clostridia bacterium]